MLGKPLLPNRYGPREGSRAAFSEEGRLRVDVKFATFATPIRGVFGQGPEQKQLSSQVAQALHAAVLFERFPKAEVDVFVLVLEVRARAGLRITHHSAERGRDAARALIARRRLVPPSLRPRPTGASSRHRSSPQPPRWYTRASRCGTWSPAAVWCAVTPASLFLWCAPLDGRRARVRRAAEAERSPPALRGALQASIGGCIYMDPTPWELTQAEATATVAMLPGSEEVTLLSMSGKWEGESSTEAFEFCVDGASRRDLQQNYGGSLTTPLARRSALESA